MRKEKCFNCIRCYDNIQICIAQHHIVTTEFTFTFIFIICRTHCHKEYVTKICILQLCISSVICPGDATGRPESIIFFLMLYLIKLQKVRLAADKIKEKLQKCSRLEDIKAQLSEMSKNMAELKKSPIISPKLDKFDSVVIDKPTPRPTKPVDMSTV